MFFDLMLRPPSRSPLFPYTTLFRSLGLLGTDLHPHVRRLDHRAQPIRREAEVRQVEREQAAGWKLAGQRPVLVDRSEEHTSELQSRQYIVCCLLVEKKKHTRLNTCH